MGQTRLSQPSSAAVLPLRVLGLVEWGITPVELVVGESRVDGPCHWETNVFDEVCREGLASRRSRDTGERTLSESGDVDDGSDAGRPQVSSGAKTATHQQDWGIDDTGAEDDFASCGNLDSVCGKSVSVDPGLRNTGFDSLPSLVVYSTVSNLLPFPELLKTLRATESTLIDRLRLPRT